MPKITMEFILPDEQEEFESASNGFKWKKAHSDFDRYLRDMIKHNPKELSDEQIDIAEQIREELHMTMVHYGLNSD